MGDPVTMAVVGGTIGAATNRKDPLKGALMGAAGGYAGGSFLPTAGAGSMFGGSAGGLGAAQGANASIAGVQGGMGALSGQSTALTGASSGMFGGMTMPSTFTGIGKDISAVNTFMNQNPTTSQIGFGLARDLMSQDPVQMAPQGQVSRSQIQPMDYMSLLNPQQQQVLRPATPSLI